MNERQIQKAEELSRDMVKSLEELMAATFRLTNYIQMIRTTDELTREDTNA